MHLLSRSLPPAELGKSEDAFIQCCVPHGLEDEGNEIVNLNADTIINLKLVLIFGSDSFC